MITTTMTHTYLRKLRSESQRKELPLPHYLTYISNVIPMVNFLPDSKRKENTSILHLYIFNIFKVIYQELPRMQFIFHNSHVTLRVPFLVYKNI